MKKGHSQSFLKGMNQDSLPSMQPEGTYRYMLNGKLDTLDHSTFGVANEESTELCFNISDGYTLVGGGYVRERDVIVLFSTNQNGVSEIGLGDIRACKYTILVNDENFPEGEKLCFANNEWIKPQIKRIQPCNEIMVYWSNNDTYRRINIDDSSCKYSSSGDFELFKCICGPTIETRVSKSGGQGLPVGAYQVVAQLEDNDGNTTNWFFIDYPVYLTSEKNAEGDISDQSIEIRINEIDEEYDYVNIGIVSTVDNITQARLITKQPRKVDGITYNYVGQTTEQIELDLEEVFTKNPGYLKGRDLVQKDGRLILYNLMGEFNLDYQWQANGIFSKYKVLKVPAKEAHLYPNLQRDEVYRIGIVWHFCDGTSSPVYHIPGRMSTEYDREEIAPESELNCSDCKTESRWRVQNTAEQTDLFCSNVLDESVRSFQTPIHTPAQQIVTQVRSDNANNQLPAEFYDLAYTVNGEPCEGNCLGQVQTPNCPNGDCNGSIPNETDLRNSTHLAFEECKDCGAPPCYGEDCGGTGGCPEGADCAEDPNAALYPGQWSPNCFKDIDKDALYGQYSIFGNLFPVCTPDVYLTAIDGECVMTATPCSNGSCQGLNGETLSCSSSGDLPVCRTQVETYASQGAITYASDGPTAAAGDCTPEPIYDEDGCIIGYEPVVYSKGNLAYWQSEDTYPISKKCDGTFLYGKLAGAPIRDHKMPNIQLEPHYISYQNGVPHHDNYENKETNDGFVHLLTLDFCNITRPDKLPKPLCKEKPFSIVFAKRDDYNKSVIASGLFTSTFQGDIFGRSYAVPKNGVNSLEYFDRYLNSDLSTRNGYNRETHGGYNAQYPIYNFHSPETNFKQPRLSVDKASIEFEYFGSGWMYGHVAKGKKQESINGIEMNNKGMRHSVHLNHYDKPLIEESVKIKNPNNPCCNTYTLNITQTTQDLDVCEVFGQRYQVIQIKLEAAIGNLPTGTLPSVFNINLDLNTGVGDAQLYRQYSPGDCLSEPLGTNFDETVNNRNTYTGWFFLGIPIDPFGPPTQTFNELIYTVTATVGACNYRAGGGLNFVVSPNVTPSEQQSISLTSNQCDYIFTGPEGLITRCIKGISYVDADSILNKEQQFSLPLLNLKREQSVVVEFKEPEQMVLKRAIEAKATGVDRYNGTQNNGNLTPNQTSDGSFIGDLYVHERPIYNAAAWYGTLKYDNRRQYGRLEALRYQRLYDGTEEALLCGNVSGIGGDTWIGPYSIRRTSYISDKVGHHPVPPEKVSLEGWGLLASFMGITNEGEAADVLGHTCDCGKPAENVEKEDCRNWAGLRYPEPVDTWLGPGTDLPYAWEDTLGSRNRPSCEDHRTEEWNYPADVFYPGTIKSNVTFWTESQINVWNRKTGDEDLSEVAYPRLGRFELDPAMPKYTSWQDTFLAKFYVELERASKVRILIYTLICWFFLIIFPILIVAIAGLIGAAISLIILGFWTSRTGSKLREFLRSVLGFDNCLGDKFEINRDGWVKDFAPAYHGYNWDYSKLNDLEQFLGMPDNYNTCDCLADLSQTVYYSNQQLIGSLIDAYRNFKPNNFVDVPADAGQIQTFFYRGNQFFVHTSDNIWNLYSDETTLQAQNGENIFLGRGDLFSSPRPLMGGIPEGWMGTLDPNASINTPFGYVFIDEESKGIFIFGGDSPKEITQVGMRSFFKENLGFKLKEQFPDYELRDEKSVLGVSYSLAYEPRHNRLILTKVDYMAKNPAQLKYEGSGVFKDGKKTIYVTNEKYFDNVSFTASYDLTRNLWISFHSYIPRAYFWDRDHLYSFHNGAIWKHDSVRDDYQTFYGEYYPFVLDFPFRGNNLESVEPESIILDTEASEWHDMHQAYTHGKLVTYTDIIAYTSNQSTNKLSIKTDTGAENRQKDLQQSSTELKASRKDNTWRIAGFKNQIKDESQPIFKKSKDFKQGNKELNTNNIEIKPKQFKSSIFFDKQFNVRLIFSNLQFKSVRLITKLAALMSRERQE